jgi:thiol-disulfide isomerase/thioredoxin
MALFAQFSFLIATLVGGALLLLGLWRWQRGNPYARAGIFAWYVLGVLVIGLVFRYPAANAATPADVERILDNGKPTLVMLYSNFCLGCMAALPNVQAMLPDLQNANINVVLLDVNTSPARDMLARFDFVSTPTFLLYDADGAEIRRSGRILTYADIQAAMQ